MYFKHQPREFEEENWIPCYSNECYLVKFLLMFKYKL